jgi:hypothetical protein
LPMDARISKVPSLVPGESVMQLVLRRVILWPVTG